MHRRAFLKTTAAALGARYVAGLPAAQAATLESRARMRPLPPVLAAWDRVVRSTVGLRPYRASGFVLRSEAFGDKTLIHNYGHGGAGMSLGWGCGSLVADIAAATPHRRAAVIGCGSPGLTAARQLQRRGFAVTIYAATIPPNTTSNMSMATFSPTSGLIASDRRTSEWDAQFRRAMTVSYRELLRLARGPYGISWIDSFVATDVAEGPASGTDDTSLLPASFYTPPARLEPGEHPFPTRFALRTRSLRIEPAIYLAALVRDFTRAGGRIVIRTFEQAAALGALAEPVVVNCTGLGTRSLFGDQELIPVRGQLTVLAPQPEIAYRTSLRTTGADGRPGTTLGMMPRRDGIVLGNTQERGNWSLEPDDATRRRMVGEAIAFFSAMRRPG